MDDRGVGLGGRGLGGRGFGLGGRGLGLCRRGLGLSGRGFGFRRRSVGFGGRFGLFRLGGLGAQQSGHGVAHLAGHLDALVQAVSQISRGVIGTGAGKFGHDIPGFRALLVGGAAGGRNIRGGLVQPVVGAILEIGELFVLHGHGQRKDDQEHADAQRQQRHQQLRADLHAHLPAPQHHHAEGPQDDRYQQREEYVEEARGLAAGWTSGLAAAGAVGVGALFRTHHIAAAARGKRLQQAAALCLFVSHLHDMPPPRGRPRSAAGAPVSDRPFRPDTHIYIYIIASRTQNLKRQHCDGLVLQMCAGKRVKPRQGFQ